MTSFKRLLGGILLMLTCTASASNFSCQVPANFQNLSCEGSVEVKNLTELIAYKNNLAMKKGKAKNLIIDFDLSTNALTISTPCKITINERRALSVAGDLCLHANGGIKIEESIDLHANNVRLESNVDIIISAYADIEANNFEHYSQSVWRDIFINIIGSSRKT